MAADKGKKRRQFLPHNRPVRKKGAYPLRPGVQGFFITCDGGRERQASHEAIYVLDSYYEELVHGKCSDMKREGIPNKPLNKKIVFASSSDDENDDDNDVEEEEETVEGEEKEEGGEDEKEEGKQADTCKGNDGSQSLTNKKPDPHDSKNLSSGKEMEAMTGENKEDGKNHESQAMTGENKEDGKNQEAMTGENKEDGKNHESQANEAEEPPAKKQCLEADASKSVKNNKVEEKSIDKLIEAELKELGDKSKRRFVNLDSGCNGLAVVQMRKMDGDPSPKDIVQHMMTSIASTRKPVSRSILRVLPIELACYASEEEISRTIQPLVAKYFPVETQNPQKFAVLYEARANSGIDRMKIINAVAKSVPAPHKVDLSNPDKTIVVEIVKTVCMIGVVEKYKELAKYNLRQLTSPKQ